MAKEEAARGISVAGQVQYAQMDWSEQADLELSFPGRWSGARRNGQADPYGEESRFPTRIKPRFFTPLRSVQNDTIGVLGQPANT